MPAPGCWFCGAVANSFLNIKFPGKDEEKISKSRGTAIWVEDYLETFDPDPLRYYLTAMRDCLRTRFPGVLDQSNISVWSCRHVRTFYEPWQRLLARADPGQRV